MSDIVRRDSFQEVMDLITTAQEKTFNQINKSLLELYWSVGEYISTEVTQHDWGKSTVEELSLFIKSRNSNIKGFTSRNIWRMKLFYETYSGNVKLSPLVSQLSWSNNLLIFSRCKTEEEREFYIKLSIKSRLSKRDLGNKIDSGTFERVMLSDAKTPRLFKELPQDVTGVFKDSYILDFLDLPTNYKEKDLQSALISNLKDFILELGLGFSFIGEKVRVEVGNSNFELDLLFYHRDLQCMVVFELKTTEFKPSHLGQLSFYMEAMDKQEKREHENPTIGVLLCRSKDDEVVELALNSNLSPTLVAEYETKMIPKELLRQKMNEFYNILESKEDNL